MPPERLGRHVRQAIEIGGARRIGHATDVMYDVDPAALMQEMARKRIAVEVSLSSSDMILGVSGPRHPLRQFLRAGAPVVIATDDEGVARSDLTTNCSAGRRPRRRAAKRRRDEPAMTLARSGPGRTGPYRASP